MENTPTSPATRTFCVWADWNRRVYQEIDATSAEEAYRLAKENPGGWLPCIEHDDNGYRLSNDVQDAETNENVTVGGAQHCKTCGSEIVETVNETFFRDCECGPCEYRRYRSQPALLAAIEYLLKQTVEMDLAHGIALTEGEKEARGKALAAITQAHGNAA